MIRTDIKNSKAVSYLVLINITDPREWYKE